MICAIPFCSRHLRTPSSLLRQSSTCRVHSARLMFSFTARKPLLTISLPYDCARLKTIVHNRSQSISIVHFVFTHIFARKFSLFNTVGYLTVTTIVHAQVVISSFLALSGVMENSSSNCLNCICPVSSSVHCGGFEYASVTASMSCSIMPIKGQRDGSPLLKK